jgi:hypothetical protein
MSYKRNGVIPKMWCHTAVLAGVESQSRCGVDVASQKFFGATSNCGGMVVYGLHGTTLAIRFHTGCSFPDVSEISKSNLHHVVSHAEGS